MNEILPNILKIIVPLVMLAGIGLIFNRKK